MTAAEHVVAVQGGAPLHQSEGVVAGEGGVGLHESERRHKAGISHNAETHAIAAQAGLSLDPEEAHPNHHHHQACAPFVTNCYY